MDYKDQKKLAQKISYLVKKGYSSHLAQDIVIREDRDMKARLRQIAREATK